ncbi:hypothetical protein HZA33_04535 [Candidatus Pacearchaeota archaeon]|nr:hypothetical protein [Candidatus Pacearchaeota archaeon]
MKIYKKIGYGILGLAAAFYINIPINLALYNHYYDKAMAGNQKYRAIGMKIKSLRTEQEREYSLCQEIDGFLNGKLGYSTFNDPLCGYRLTGFKEIKKIPQIRENLESMGKNLIQVKAKTEKRLEEIDKSINSLGDKLLKDPETAPIARRLRFYEKRGLNPFLWFVGR